MDGKEYTFTFGDYPTLRLAEVRDQTSMKCSCLKQQGVNPSQQKAKNKREKKYKNLNTFESLAIDWIENLYKPSVQENTWKKNSAILLSRGISRYWQDSINRTKRS